MFLVYSALYLYVEFDLGAAWSEVCKGGKKQDWTENTMQGYREKREKRKADRIGLSVVGAHHLHTSSYLFGRVTLQLQSLLSDLGSERITEIEVSQFDLLTSRFIRSFLK